MRVSGGRVRVSGRSECGGRVRVSGRRVSISGESGPLDQTCHTMRSWV